MSGVFSGKGCARKSVSVCRVPSLCEVGLLWGSGCASLDILHFSFGWFGSGPLARAALAALSFGGLVFPLLGVLSCGAFYQQHQGLAHGFTHGEPTVYGNVAHLAIDFRIYQDVQGVRV